MNPTTIERDLFCLYIRRGILLELDSDTTKIHLSVNDIPRYKPSENKTPITGNIPPELSFDRGGCVWSWEQGVEELLTFSRWVRESKNQRVEIFAVHGDLLFTKVYNRNEETLDRRGSMTGLLWSDRKNTKLR